MRPPSDRTGAVTRVMGLGGLLLLVATAATLREPPPANPSPAPAPARALEPVTAPPHAEVLSKRFQGVIPAYPRTKLTPMGRMSANGNPMEMAFFETTDAADDVLEFYAREFRKAGHHLANEPDGAGGGAVSYYDAKRGAIISVTAIGLGGAKPLTQVFPSIVEAQQGVHLQARAPASLPRPPGAMTMLRVDDHTPGPSKDSITVTEVAQGTPRALSDFYVKQFETRGYTLTEAPSFTQGVAYLDFIKPGERVSLSLSPVDTEGAPQTLVTVVLEQTPDKEHAP
ncbi:hypothetical protein LZ198_24995 [Myxococcus sp. K15C18031901]|uniref:hypothetical protein n=1 Tax=Myxococcus dinghuensis TaxID=2906761 RepID=UPI0020A715AE|nr:hypothetical protein [Myxococcus dinghuensis]MCP3102130.1 hypothetical protein [Myxococcus dinghuensis]